jgi:hypothetical protein
MNALPTLTTKQKKSLLAFHKASKPGTTQYLNPSNPTHRAFIETMLAAAGHTAQDYPHLHNALASGKAYKGDRNADKVKMVDAGKTKSGKATGTIWSLSNSDTMIKGGNLMVFDSGSGKLLAQGENTVVKNGFLTCPTRTATAAPTPSKKKLSLLYLGHATNPDGATRFFSYADNAVADDSGIMVNVTAPVNGTGNLTPDTTIAVGRNFIYSTTNYVYLEPNPSPDPINNPFLISPFVGNVSLGGTIDLPSLVQSDLDTEIYLSSTSTSAVSTLISPTGSAMTSAFSIGATPNVLQFNFPYDQKGYQTTQSIVYSQSNLNTNSTTYFYFAFNNIPYEGGGSSAPFFVCSVNSPEEGSANCTNIPNLQFQWHCVPKGTLVTLDNGKKVPVEKITDRSRVKTLNGSLAVIGTVIGKHKSNPAKGDRAEIFKLVTANGKTVVATENHMIFMKADKCRMISHMQAGDPVMTDQGPSTVKSCKAISGNAMFYGLILGNKKEKAGKKFPHNMAGYYAGGILSGDQETMRHNISQAHEDLNYMLPRIKAELRHDYASAVILKRFK